MSKDTVVLNPTHPPGWALDLYPKEVAYCLYMPVSPAGCTKILLNPRKRPDLAFAVPALYRIKSLEGVGFFAKRNVYLTVKRMYVSHQVTANRPGWHSDGFGTTDVNYIWYDCLPTVLSAAKEFVVSTDHVKSLQQFEEQAEAAPTYSIPPHHLIRLTSEHVHKVAMAEEQMMRTFVKVSMSESEYNLEGNSTNPQVPPPKKIYPRSIIRNDPSRAQKDYYNPVDPHFQ